MRAKQALFIRCACRGTPLKPILSASESVIRDIERLHFTTPLHPSSISGLGIEGPRRIGLRVEVKNK